MQIHLQSLKNAVGTLNTQPDGYYYLGSSSVNFMNSCSEVKPQTYYLPKYP